MRHFLNLYLLLLVSLGLKSFHNKFYNSFFPDRFFKIIGQIYLSGKYDTVVQPNDHCGNAIQGGNRHERADLFYSGLQEYFGKPELPVHTFHTVPNSNHDHSLMFQSSLGRNAIFGPSTDKPKSAVKAVAALG